MAESGVPRTKAAKQRWSLRLQSAVAVIISVGTFVGGAVLLNPPQKLPEFFGDGLLIVAAVGLFYSLAAAFLDLAYGNEGALKRLERTLTNKISAEYVGQTTAATREFEAKLSNAIEVTNTIIEMERYLPEDWARRREILETFLTKEGRIWKEIAHQKYLAVPEYREAFDAFSKNFKGRYLTTFVDDTAHHIDFVIADYVGDMGADDEGTSEVYFGWNAAVREDIPGVLFSRSRDVVKLFRSHWNNMARSAKDVRRGAVVMPVQVCGVWCDAIFDPDPSKPDPTGYGLLVFMMTDGRVEVCGKSFTVQGERREVELHHWVESTMGVGGTNHYLISGPQRESRGLQAAPGVSLYAFTEWGPDPVRPTVYEGFFGSERSPVQSVQGFLAEGRLSAFVAPGSAPDDSDIQELWHDRPSVHSFLAALDKDAVKTFVDAKLALHSSRRTGAAARGAPTATLTPPR